MNIEEAEVLLEKHCKDEVGICPHCGAKAHIELLWFAHHECRRGDIEFYVIFRCKPCKKLSLKTWYLEQSSASRQKKLSFRGWNDAYPILLDEQLRPEEKKYVPVEVLLDYEEALKFKSVGADKASCAMFRRALQTALVKLGAKSGDNLIGQIDHLSVLPSDIKDWAHQIRIFGNWGAHPDEDQLKNLAQEDVEDVHDFMSKFLLYTFIMPAKVRASRGCRDAREAPQDAPESE